MKEIIEDLFKMNRNLLGEGYDSAIEYINTFMPLEIIRVPTDTKVGTWYVPDEWVIRDGWIKLNGEKIADYKKDPLCVTVYSLPVNEKVTWDVLKKHLHISDEQPKAFSYDYRFYDKDWGFSMPKEEVAKLPQDAEYEVFIDAEHISGEMKIGIHTIKGSSEREILLFAHLDHPYQANDNLSGVACLMDMARKLQGKFKHTIKLIFCPETIGSIAYAELTDISKVDFVIAVDSIGNDNTLLFQKAYDKMDRTNFCLHLAVAGQGVSYRKGDFRLVYGADEYYFNDPKVGIPGFFLSRLPFDEYHTSGDTPDKIKYEKIEEVQKVIIKMIDIYEKDFIPERLFKGPLMRSKFGIQSSDKNMNRELDFLMYDMDGKKWLSELVIGLGIDFDYAYRVLQVLINSDVVTTTDGRPDAGKVKIKPSSRKKHS